MWSVVERLETVLLPDGPRILSTFLFAPAGENHWKTQKPERFVRNSCQIKQRNEGTQLQIKLLTYFRVFGPFLLKVFLGLIKKVLNWKIKRLKTYMFGMAPGLFKFTFTFFKELLDCMKVKIKKLEVWFFNFTDIICRERFSRNTCIKLLEISF